MSNSNSLPPLASADSRPRVHQVSNRDEELESRIRETWPRNNANLGNLAAVARIMKLALPENAKIAKEAKECMQECVSEFISFITSEGTCFHSSL